LYAIFRQKGTTTIPYQEAFSQKREFPIASEWRGKTDDLCEKIIAAYMKCVLFFVAAYINSHRYSGCIPILLDDDE